ncbi:MAG: hypothetical protein N3B13_05480 [Deltaproteobacteria bacterium]|nr:hypothetical protein [Deltaproteobacteria bacterium]
MKKVIIFLLILSVFVSFAYAKEPVSVNHKQLYTHMSMDFSLPTKTYYNGDSEAMPAGLEREYSENFYRLGLTYGLLEKLNFDFGFRIWQAERSVASKEDQMKKYYIDEPLLRSPVEKTRLLDFEVGFRLLLKEYFFRHSIAASIFIPASNKYDPEPYNIGDGRFFLKIRYLFEKDVGQHMIFGNSGFAFYDERPENQYILELNYGYKIMENLYAGIGIGMYIPLSMDDNTNPFETVAQDVGSFNLIPRIGYRPIENLNLEITYNYTMGGYNTFLFNTIGFNASYLF